MTAWLSVTRGDAPLVLSLPHTGTAIAADLLPQFRSSWLARRDADWWIDRLYGFASSLGATLIHTAVSRSVIDVNRDPSGAPLYPGQTTTALCPTENFDGEPLYHPDAEPDVAEIERRRQRWHAPYHAAITEELTRLSTAHANVVLFDCHSIRSHIPQLFAGELPHFNIGSHDGASCDPSLTESIAAICANSGLRYVVNGRFKGGYITRHYGHPSAGIHAVQMELAMRTYLNEHQTPSPENWPPQFDAARCEPVTKQLHAILAACLEFTTKALA